MMQASTLKQAIKEAKRFIQLAEAVPITTSKAMDSWQYVEAGKASGAARRTSMDLSRVLSDLRLNR
jgi:hypothetical protein